MYILDDWGAMIKLGVKIMGIKNEKKWYFEGVNKLLSFPDEVIDKEKYIEEFIQGFLEGHNDYITPEMMIFYMKDLTFL